MHVLMVLAHPLADSYTASVAETATRAFEDKGHSVDMLDLYEEGFDPVLSAAERGGYFDVPYDTSAVDEIVKRLKAADGLVLVFPQWWFNFPAILKGFFDRVFAPGVAFDHEASGGRIIPRLTHIKLFWALTSTGSPWWVAKIYMGDPVRRLLKRGIAAFCAKRVDFRMISLHDMDRSTPERRQAHLAKVARTISKL